MVLSGSRNGLFVVSEAAGQVTTSAVPSEPQLKDNLIFDPSGYGQIPALRGARGASDIISAGFAAHGGACAKAQGARTSVFPKPARVNHGLSRNTERNPAPVCPSRPRNLRRRGGRTGARHSPLTRPRRGLDCSLFRT